MRSPVYDYVGLSSAVLLAQHHEVVALDVVALDVVGQKVAMLNLYATCGCSYGF